MDAMHPRSTPPTDPFVARPGHSTPQAGAHEIPAVGARDPRRGRLRLLLVGLTALLLAGGCDSNGASEVISIEGSYSLESFEGSELPVVVDESEDGIRELLAGQLTLSEDATCERTLELRVTLDDMVDSVTETDSCLWSGNPDQLEVVWEDDRIYLGALIGNDLTLSGASGVYVYRR